MSNETDNHLRGNRKAFYLMTDDTQMEMQKKYESDIGCVEYLDKETLWVKCGSVNPEDNQNFTFRLSPDYAPETEMVECAVYDNGISSPNLIFYHLADKWEISKACNFPDFIGFKYEDGNIYPQPVMYSENGGFHFISQIESFASGKDIANRPTHVLFRKATP